MRTLAVVGVLLLAAGPALGENAVGKGGGTAKESAPTDEAPPESRHPAPARTSEPTAAPTSAPREERREERREWHKEPDTPAPTAEPTRKPDPTPEPEPTPTPDWRTDAERRHPRPEGPRVEPAQPPASVAAPPAAAPALPPPRRGDHDDDSRRSQDRNDSHDSQDRHDRQDGHDRRDAHERREGGPGWRPSRAERGHLGPHYHARRFVPESCPRDVRVVRYADSDPDSDPSLPNYDGMAALRLIVDPPDTRVFVDGYFAGNAEDFDGLFQRLHVPEGCHEIALVLPNHRSHRVRLDATPSRVSKIRHEMRAGEGNDVEDLSEGVCRAERATPPPAPNARDFEIERYHWFMARGRMTTLVGLVRGVLGGVPASVVVRVEARSEGGAVVASERESRVDVDGTGAFLASYRIDLAPGRYAVRLDVREPVSGRGSALTGSIDVPDLHASRVTVPSVLILESMRLAPTDPRHPLGALVLEQAMPVPRFGNRFLPTDAPMILFQFARPASASAIHATYAILGPEGTMRRHDARVQVDQVAVSAGRAVGAAAFGPISLAGYSPGRYRVLVTVTDVESKAAYAQEAWFEVHSERTALSWSGDTPSAAGAVPKP